MKTAIISIVTLLILSIAVDWLSDGILIDMLEKRFGYSFARNVRDSKYAIVIGIGACIVIWNFLVVERYALKTVSNVFSNIGVVFQKDQEKLNFHGEFQELEDDLNHLKEERIRQEDLVQRDAQRRADMLAYLAHDIKTPLASVIGYLCLLDENEDLPEELRKKYTHLTLEKANRMETLMNEFFDITRFNLGDIPFEKQSIDVSYMLAQMADEFYPMLTPGNRRAEISAQPELYIYVDPDKTARVFNNILKNAISYSDENSVISIQAQKKDGMAEISFENSGPEIPADTINSIFDKFYRVDISRSSRTGGAGLGLAIAKEIVEQHGGTITVSSFSHKTKFMVRLPLDTSRRKEVEEESK
ncbi:MAG: sensor histidine kinase [Lachnospiraceae bacterium]